MFDRKSYYRKNREKYLSYAKQWRTENPEKFRAQKKRSRENQRKNNYVGVMLRYTKVRAKKKGVPFALTTQDVQMPTHCPILGIELCTTNKGLHADNSPSLDRIVPALGYVPGNVIVISWRANRIKCDASLAELQLIAKFYGTLAESA